MRGHWVVVDNASPSLQDAPSACQQVPRVLSFEGPRGRASTLPRRTESAVHRRRGVLPRPSVSRVTAPGARRCRRHKQEERRGLVGACRVDPGPSGRRDSVPRGDEKQAFLPLLRRLRRSRGTSGT